MNAVKKLFSGKISQIIMMKMRFFYKEIYRGSTNAFLERQTLHLQNRLKPYRRVQLRFRGRMLESLQEHEAIVDALQKGDEDRAGKIIKRHVTVQGEKFHQLMAGLKPD